MSDVQIPVGFRRKARMDPPVVFAGFDVFIDDVFDKIRRRYKLEWFFYKIKLFEKYQRD
jgi:hypothetical protein